MNTTTAVLPTAVLSAEHRVIERALDVLTRMADGADEGSLDTALAGEMLDFLRTFADRCHHGKEEGLLFPAMENEGLSAEHGPTSVMRGEHAEGREWIRRMAVAVDAGDRDAFAGAARGYVGLLREHILKEDQILFPMADRMLSRKTHEELLRAFRRVEHDDLGPGTHERMLGLLDRAASALGLPAAEPASGGCGCSCGHG